MVKKKVPRKRGIKLAKFATIDKVGKSKHKKLYFDLPTLSIVIL